MIDFFFQKKKKNSVQHPKMVVFRFWDRIWEPFRKSKTLFLKIQLTRIVFWVKIYRELPCRCNHYIIISGSRWKVEKTMKNSVFSNFECDAEIMVKWLHITVISSKFHTKKHYDKLLFPQKKKIQSDFPKWSFSDFETEPETPFRESKIFFHKI